MLALPAFSLEGVKEQWFGGQAAYGVTEMCTQISFPCLLSVAMENSYFKTLILLTDIYTGLRHEICLSRSQPPTIYTEQVKKGFQGKVYLQLFTIMNLF